MTLETFLNSIDRDRQTVVLATGVFDIFHQEHRAFLEHAKQAGDVLVVGVETDQRVRAMKGAGRPVNTADERMKVVAALPFVDYVFLLPEQFSKPQDHIDLIARIKPDILAVSSHTAHLDKKRAILEAHGGRVEIVHQHNPEVSTTQLLG